MSLGSISPVFGGQDSARILDRPDGDSPGGSQALRFFRNVVSPTGIVDLAVRSLGQIGRVSDPT